MLGYSSRWLLLIVLALMAPVSAACAQEAAAATPRVLALTVDGAISPASAAYVVGGIEQAQEEAMQAVLLRIDTPGGLGTSMRDIIKAIMASSVPVICYVAPSGSRAASAGTYILQACHVAAMAPATNLGAATPIQLLGAEQTQPAGAASTGVEPTSAEARKVLNDAVAYIRALAQQRGRNADWAEKAVRDAASLAAQQALEKNVIDIVAPNRAALIAALDGRTVQLQHGETVLHTADARLVSWSPGWRIKFLSVIANPTVAYLLLLIGIVGLLLEGLHPGAVLPGVVGAICLLLALYAFQLLPVNFAGLALIVLGVALIVAEAFVPTFGALGIGGVVSFVIGSVVLMDTDVPGFELSLPVLVAVALVAALLMAGIVWMALRSTRQPLASGQEEMVGMRGEAAADFDGRGRVHVHGEYWQAHCDHALTRGQAVRVLAIHGLMLEVEPDPETRLAGEE